MLICWKRVEIVYYPEPPSVSVSPSARAGNDAIVAQLVRLFDGTIEAYEPMLEASREPGIAEFPGLPPWLEPAARKPLLATLTDLSAALLLDFDPSSEAWLDLGRGWEDYLDCLLDPVRGATNLEHFGENLIQPAGPGAAERSATIRSELKHIDRILTSLQKKLAEPSASPGIPFESYRLMSLGWIAVTRGRLREALIAAGLEPRGSPADLDPRVHVRYWLAAVRTLERLHVGDRLHEKSVNLQIHLLNKSAGAWGRPEGRHVASAGSGASPALSTDDPFRWVTGILLRLSRQSPPWPRRTIDQEQLRWILVYLLEIREVGEVRSGDRGEFLEAVWWAFDQLEKALSTEFLSKPRAAQAFRKEMIDAFVQESAAILGEAAGRGVLERVLPGVARGASRREEIAAGHAGRVIEEMWKLLAVEAFEKHIEKTLDPITGRPDPPPGREAVVQRCVNLLIETASDLQRRGLEGDVWLELADVGWVTLGQAWAYRAFDRGSPFGASLRRLRDLLTAPGRAGLHRECFARTLAVHMDSSERETRASSLKAIHVLRECSDRLASIESRSRMSPAESYARIRFSQRAFSLAEMVQKELIGGAPTAFGDWPASSASRSSRRARSRSATCLAMTPAIEGG